MTVSHAIRGRALLAVALVIGFYLLALGIACGLAYIPYAEGAYLQRIHTKLTVVCILAALAIVWSVLPRFDKFKAPGPALTQAKQPRLFKELEGVARFTQQALPAEIYLLPDVNAWVTQRGGIMGFGSRRVMGLGLPLLHLLTRSQFRAVLVHEFGHYYGGDTTLGPWIYQTRNAIGRTLAILGGADGKGGWLQLPFLWYGKLFLRLTHAVSRRQEFVADTLAARAVGAKPLMDGLCTVHSVAPEFQAYWVNECGPVLRAGSRPSLVEGFANFIATAPIAAAITTRLDAALEGTSDPYDTHPSLKERLAAVADIPAGHIPENDPPALSLLDDVAGLEGALLVVLAGDEVVRKLKPLVGLDVGNSVNLPQWQTLVQRNAAGLDGLTPEALPRQAANVMAFATRFVTVTGNKVDAADAVYLAGAVIGAALTGLLMSQGGMVNCPPGKTVTVTHKDVALEPFHLFLALINQKTTAEAWRQQCDDLGITGANLAGV